MTSSNADFGVRIRHIRELRGLKAGAIARLVGVDGPTLSRWESGQTAVPLVKLTVLAVALNVCMNFLLDVEEQGHCTDTRDVKHDLREILREYAEERRHRCSDKRCAHAHP